MYEIKYRIINWRIEDDIILFLIDVLLRSDFTIYRTYKHVIIYKSAGNVQTENEGRMQKTPIT